MSSTSAVYNGCAPTKPDHTYSHLEMCQGQQTVWADETYVPLHRTPLQVSCELAARLDKVAAVVKAANAAFGRH
ncbi:hypothetical protein NOR_06703 [Metarhizium rileyi]|uniref:Uncharacterized protein n=1 Tax=Metarhizium rileyi (strain RCEF 4871) TaxID=1649241 RepID=A0A166ZWK0_METRR|nr:hypothetical protein NOR_06703 [Metarhizium rileyi RCEF 4871]TWU71094.1 hypothetical protein ED733_002953 [Metarhizium rileyi]